MDEDWLAQLFSKHGLVLDVFIPRKRSKRFNTKFGFIRFKSRKEALDAIADLNGLTVRGRRILVKLAAFGTTDSKSYPAMSNFDRRFHDLETKKNPMRYWMHSGKVGFTRTSNKSYAEIVNDKGSSEPPIKLLELGNEWLQRSAIAKLGPSRSIVSVQDHLASLGVVDIQVRPMGGDYLVLTFPSVEARDSVFNNGKLAWLNEWFLEIHKWDKNRVFPQSRLVWLNFYGIPLHLWNSVTFNRLGEKWGKVIQVSNDTINVLSFAVAKVLISTQVMGMINQVISVENGGVRFQVRVCEEQVVVNTTLRADCNCNGCIHMEQQIQGNDMITKLKNHNHDH